MDRSRLVREITQRGISFQNEKLKVVKELGSGGNGVAFQCVNAAKDVVVAKIYIPSDNRDLDPQSLARFEREIRLTTDLQHPNVIRALASGSLKVGAYTLPFYTMPLAPRTLRDLVKPWQNVDELSTIFRFSKTRPRGHIPSFQRNSASGP